jgi:hypothetical protein
MSRVRTTLEANPQADVQDAQLPLSDLTILMWLCRECTALTCYPAFAQSFRECTLCLFRELNRFTLE